MKDIIRTTLFDHRLLVIEKNKSVERMVFFYEEGRENYQESNSWDGEIPGECIFRPEVIKIEQVMKQGLGQNPFRYAGMKFIIEQRSYFEAPLYNSIQYPLYHKAKDCVGNYPVLDGCKFSIELRFIERPLIELGLAKLVSVKDEDGEWENLVWDIGPLKIYMRAVLEGEYERPIC